MKSISKSLKIFLILTLYTIVFVSCTDEEEAKPAPIAAFTFEVEDFAVSFTNTSENATSYSWNFGDDEISTDENPSHTYAEAGTYTVTLTATGEGGEDEMSQDVIIEEVADLIAGGDMEDASVWTVIAASSETLVTHTFAEGVLKFSAEDGAEQKEVILYQAINIPTGDYKFSADITGTGSTNMWFEILFVTDEPQEGSALTNGLFLGMNTWEGCGTEAFEGNFAELACKGTGVGQDGLYTHAGGTIYVAIQAGTSANFGEITIDNLKLVSVE